MSMAKVGGRSAGLRKDQRAMMMSVHTRRKATQGYERTSVPTTDNYDTTP